METSISIQVRSARCPNCAADVRLVGRLLVGEVFGCSACGAQLEVASPDPLVLDRFARVEDEEEYTR